MQVRMWYFFVRDLHSSSYSWISNNKNTATYMQL